MASLTLKNPSASRLFPREFCWGAASAATQVEGAADEDGKGPSVWDVFPRHPGATRNGDSPAVACDHYHRYREDADLMVRLGVKHYRLSIAWTRIMPDGVGTLNRRGLDFYSRLLDTLLERGITPWVTMFHFDLPQALEEKGGWPTRQVVDAFADYADTIVKAYGDRVKNWITLNEITVFVEAGYGKGGFAPGRSEDFATVHQGFHHAALCHGHGVRAVREHGGAGARVGLTDNSRVLVPIAETAADIAAAQTAFREANCRILEPICTGAYGEVYRRHTEGWLPQIAPGDMELMSAPTDFLGLNIYTGGFARAGADGRAETVPVPAHYPTADSPWLKMNARALYWGPRHAVELFGAKGIVITENGAGYDEVPPVNGQVNDLHRLEYIRACLGELHRGIGDGVPVRGYFAWSLMDNYEWTDGYARRFGLVYNDFETQQRTPKASALWYREVMKANALV